MNRTDDRRSGARGHGQAPPADRWQRAGSDLLLVAAGLSWASLWAASLLASPLYLALRLRDDAAGGAGDDL